MLLRNLKINISIVKIFVIYYIISYLCFMKDRKFYFIAICVGLVLAAFIISAPDGYAHRDRVKEELRQLMSSRLMKRTGASKQLNNAMIDFTVDHSLYVDDYYFCTVGRMTIGGSEVSTSVGVLGKVFLINEERVKQQVNSLNIMK